MSVDQELLQIYEVGELTVLGFNGREVLDQLNIADCRNRIASLVEEYGCKVIAFDLTGVKLIPSGLLGLLASLYTQGIEVLVYNPSDDVREVLEITNLDRFVQLHELEV